ncbi:hypothetical protein [Clavibacter zhangzhiyongii]|uniref:hypothetical protein n=1 Tax=Clavibacter zhangzhiyongii TaxID=2768071 RepID=UPI0039E0B265
MPTHPSRRTVAESRWPAAVGLLAAVALYGVAPTAVPAGARIAVVAVAVALLVPLVALNPRRLDRETAWSRGLGLALGGLLLVANQVSLVALVMAHWSTPRRRVPSSCSRRCRCGRRTSWRSRSSTGSWIAAVRWRVGRTPARRSRPPTSASPRTRTPAPCPRSPAARPSTRTGCPASSTTRTSRSRTRWRTAPPTPCRSATAAKGLMSLQAFAGFVILALVIARAVNILD